MIQLVTDSTCDLPAEAIDRLGIEVIPAYINVEDQGYVDDGSFSRTWYYESLATFDPHPTTAAPGPDIFRRAYEGLLERGAEHILSIHLSSTFSAMRDNALVAAKQVGNSAVTVCDSRQVSLGLGIQVLRAAEAVRAGKTVEEILAMLGHLAKRTHLFAALETLEHLRRSGRLSAVRAGLGTLLNVKPVISISDGQAASENVRTWGKAVRRVVELVETVSPIEWLGIAHASAPESARRMADDLAHLIPTSQVLTVEITPVIGTHTGPGAVGAICVSRAGD